MHRGQGRSSAAARRRRPHSGAASSIGRGITPISSHRHGSTNQGISAWVRPHLVQHTRRAQIRRSQFRWRWWTYPTTPISTPAPRARRPRHFNLGHVLAIGTLSITKESGDPSRIAGSRTSVNPRSQLGFRTRERGRGAARGQRAGTLPRMTQRRCGRSESATYLAFVSVSGSGGFGLRPPQLPVASSWAVRLAGWARRSAVRAATPASRRALPTRMRPWPLPLRIAGRGRGADDRLGAHLAG